ncbi:unnamed protein product [Cunninghamella echinulata]
MFKVCFEISLIRCIEILMVSGYEVDFKDFEDKFIYFDKSLRWIKTCIESDNTAIYNDIVVSDYGFYDRASTGEIREVEECAYHLAELYAGEKIERNKFLDSSLIQYREYEEKMKEDL